MIPLLLLPLALLAPIAPSGAQTSLESAPLVMPFSAGPAGAPHPAGWEIVRLTDNKRLTAYDLVDDHGVIVLHARAEAAASALGHHTAFDIRAAPIVQWRWRVGTAIEGADNAVAAREDSPVRLIFEFDGNKSALSLTERAVFLVSRAASGRELPYATLMYVWSGVHPVGTVIAESAHAPHRDDRRVERQRRSRQVADAEAQPPRRLPARVRRAPGSPHRRGRADRHRQHQVAAPRRGTATSGSCRCRIERRRGAGSGAGLRPAGDGVRESFAQRKTAARRPRFDWCIYRKRCVTASTRTMVGLGMPAAPA